VHEGPLAELTREQLIAHMVGRQIAATYTREHFTPGDTLLEVEKSFGKEEAAWDLAEASGRARSREWPD